MIEFNEFIVKLGHLAYLKNKLNNRRHRFHRLMQDENPKWQKIGLEGYERTKKEMKQFTPEMRKLRQLANVSLHWDGRGHIQYILLDSNLPWYNASKISFKDFRKLHEMYLVDNILLKEEI